MWSSSLGKQRTLKQQYITAGTGVVVGLVVSSDRLSPIRPPLKILLRPIDYFLLEGEPWSF